MLLSSCRLRLCDFASTFVRNFTCTSVNNDWIRRTTTRKPELYKISRPHTLTLDELIEMQKPDILPLLPNEKNLVERCEAVVENCLKDNKERLSCVVHIGGKQFKVTVGDLISIKSHTDEIELGEVVYFDKVLLALSKNFTMIGRPLLPSDSVKVAARVVEKSLNFPVIKFHFHRRRRHKKFRIVQMPTTVFRVIDIQILNTV